ncbi:MAG: nucleotide exchange factor GrpE [Thermoguttaceae bacterium]|nr:nucleotide exchange factor GrpE [Thermoguttaceae bacterium]
MAKTKTKILTEKSKGAGTPSLSKDQSASREDIAMNQRKSESKKEHDKSNSKDTAGNAAHDKGKSGEEFTRTVDHKFDDLEQQVSDTARDVIDAVGETAAKTADKAARISESELQKLKQELEEAKDRGLRALAELENYRSRTNRAMAEDRKYAAVDLARAILPVWDNMGRAIEAAEKDFHPEAMLDGLKMMYQQFLDIFHSQHIEKIEALHEQFNPHLHESIASFPDAKFPPNTVIHESQTGFKLHDRVIRPTQVVLSAPAVAPAPADGKKSKDEPEA